MTNLGPARPESGPSQAPVQDDDAETHLSMCPSILLVCGYRPKGRTLSFLDSPSTQTVSPLCINRASISVQGPPLRAVPVASCLHQGRGDSPCSIKGSRHPCSQLPRRLAYIGPVLSTVVWTQASGQLGKEQNIRCAEDLFSRYGVVLGQPHSTSLSRACSVDAELPGVLPAHEGGSTETAWAYGIRSRSHAAWFDSYETTSALASRPSPEMDMATRHVLVSVTPFCNQTFGLWSDLTFLQAGVPLGQVSRHVVVSTDASAMGWGAMCNGHAAAGLWDPTAVAHQLPRVASSMACSAPLQNVATRQACAGLNGQHCDCCVHQLPSLRSRRISPAISSFGVRSIWGRFAPFMSQVSSIVQPMSSHVSPPFRENGNSTPR